METTNVVLPLKRLPMTKALKTLLAEVTGWPWEIRTIPRVAVGGDMIPVDAPFGILYPQWTNYSGTPFDQPDADPRWNFQASISVKRGDQAEWGHDKIVEAIIGRTVDGVYAHPIEIPGMSIMSRDMTDENDGGGASSGDSLQHDLRFAIYVTPSAT